MGLDGIWCGWFTRLCGLQWLVVGFDFLYPVAVLVGGMLWFVRLRGGLGWLCCLTLLTGLVSLWVGVGLCCGWFGGLVGLVCYDNSGGWSWLVIVLFWFF